MARSAVARQSSNLSLHRGEEAEASGGNSRRAGEAEGRVQVACVQRALLDGGAHERVLRGGVRGVRGSSEDYGW